MNRIRFGIGLAFVLLSGAAGAQSFPPGYPPPPGGFVPPGGFPPPPPGAPYGAPGTERLPSYSGSQGGREVDPGERYDYGRNTPGQAYNGQDRSGRYGRGYTDPYARRRSNGEYTGQGGSPAGNYRYEQGGYGSNAAPQQGRPAPSGNQDQYGSQGGGPGRSGLSGQSGYGSGQTQPQGRPALSGNQGQPQSPSGGGYNQNGPGNPGQYGQAGSSAGQTQPPGRGSSAGSQGQGPGLSSNPDQYGNRGGVGPDTNRNGLPPR